MVKSIEDVMAELENVEGRMTEEERENLRQMEKTPAKIEVDTNLCDLDTLKMLAEHAEMSIEEMATTCLKAGLYSMVMEIINEHLDGEEEE